MCVCVCVCDVCKWTGEGGVMCVREREVWCVCKREGGVVCVCEWDEEGSSERERKFNDSLLIIRL